MESNTQLVEARPELMSKENIQNASALLALLHGKSDSICRVFNKEIKVEKSDLQALNKMMIEKLSIHNVGTVTTSLDVTFSNKQIITFKSWPEFEDYDFALINSETKSVFIQWDFFVLIAGFEFPQRHTVSLRITASPNPSDFFKILLNGGFDENASFDLANCTMFCKVDFINNTLAEELLNVAEQWNDLCVSAYSQKDKICCFLAKQRKHIANLFELLLICSLSLLLAITVKLLISRNILSISKEIILYAFCFILPIGKMILGIADSRAKRLYDSLSGLMDIHIFSISKGDSKAAEKIEKETKYGKHLAEIVFNVLFSIALSTVFYFLGKK